MKLLRLAGPLLLISTIGCTLADKAPDSSSHFSVEHRSNDHGPPSQEYGAPPSHGYGPPKDSYEAAPKPSYGPPPSKGSYEAPKGDYGPPPKKGGYKGGHPAPSYGHMPVPMYVHAIPAYIVPVSHHHHGIHGGYDMGKGGKGSGYGGGMFIQKGKKTYFGDHIRDKFYKLKDAKDYLASGFKNFKNKVLEWKGRLLRAKGYYLADKGEDLIDEAYQNYSAGKGKGKGKGKGHYYEDEGYGSSYQGKNKGKGKGKGGNKGHYINHGHGYDDYSDEGYSYGGSGGKGGKGKGGRGKGGGGGYGNGGGKGGHGKGGKGGGGGYSKGGGHSKGGDYSDEGHEPTSHYGPPPEKYGPPPSQGYGAPPPHKGKKNKGHFESEEHDQYGPPPKDSYGPPSEESYGPPPKEAYGAPPTKGSSYSSVDSHESGGSSYSSHNSFSDNHFQSPGGYSSGSDEHETNYGPPKPMDIVDHGHRDVDIVDHGHRDEESSYASAGSHKGGGSRLPVFGDHSGSFSVESEQSSYVDIKSPAKRHAKFKQEQPKFFNSPPTRYGESRKKRSVEDGGNTKFFEGHIALGAYTDQPGRHGAPYHVSSSSGYHGQ